MTTKENFIKRYNAVKEDVIKGMEKALEKAIGNNAIDLENMEDNFQDVYPLIGAVLQREIHHCLEGNSYEWRNRQAKKMARKYRNDYRIWRDYAGDFKGNGE